MKRALLPLIAAIGLLCFGSVPSAFAQNNESITFTNIPNGHLLSYGSLTWTLSEAFLPVEYGPTDDNGYYLYLENDCLDYLYLFIEPATESLKKLPKEEKWDDCYLYLEFFADMVDEEDETVIWGEGLSIKEDRIVAAGYEYYYPAKNPEEKDEFMYFEYMVAGEYVIEAKAAAWDKKTRAEIIRILHSVKVK